MKVYLAGPINGCNDEEAKDWREYAKTLLPDTIDPMVRDYRGREMEPGIATEIVELDKLDIDGCDVVIVMYTKPSVGTSMEVLYAWEAGKIIIVIARQDEVLSPWLVYHSDRVVNSVLDACNLVGQMHE